MVGTIVSRNSGARTRFESFCIKIHLVAMAANSWNDSQPQICGALSVDGDLTPAKSHWLESCCQTALSKEGGVLGR